MPSSDLRDLSNSADRALAEHLAAEDAGGRPDVRVLIEHHPQLAAFFSDRRHFPELVGITNADIKQGEWIDNLSGTFGDFELIRKIGQGGMGSVYSARQISLGRVVALKMIRSGTLADEGVIRRFRREAEAVAQLDHPNLLPVFEVGEHAGLRYFTMPLAEGGSVAESVARFRDDLRLSTRVIIDVADGVDHAHRRGILHRDLKPANILLDGVGRPMVSDFGLAKRIDTSESSTGGAVGTPSYMAPEQALGRAGAVTTSCDVYGLGAVLFAMLTGRPPFVAESTLEVLRLVVDQAPERPSRLNPRVDSRLEAICLKCLEKDPRRRYSSAAGLALDLRRWIRGEPIEAKPTGRVARLALWCRRRPLVAGLAGAFAASTLIGASSTWRNYLEMRRQRDAAQNWSSFLAEDFLGQSGDAVWPRRDEPLSASLNRAARAAARRFAGQPELEARAHRLICDTYRSIDLLAESERALAAVARLRAAQDQVDEVESLSDRQSEAALRLAQGRIAEALQLASTVHERRRVLAGESSEATLEAALLLSSALRAAGRSSEAEDHAARSLATCREVLTPSHRITRTAMNNVAVLAADRRRFSEAEPLFLQLRDILSNLYGQNHIEYNYSLNNLGSVHLSLGRISDAVEVLSSCHAWCRRSLAEDHPFHRQVTANLAAARSLESYRRLVAHPTFGRAANLARRLMNHPVTRILLSRPGVDIPARTPTDRGALRTAHAAAMRLFMEGRPGVSADALRRLLGDARRWLDPGDADLNSLLGNTAFVLSESKEYAEADQLAAEAIRLHEMQAEPDRERLGNLLILRAGILLAMNRLVDAEPLCRRALSLRQSNPKELDWKVATARSMLGASLIGRGDPDQVQNLLKSAYGCLRRARGAPRVRVDEARHRLAAFYIQQGRPALIETLD